MTSSGDAALSAESPHTNARDQGTVSLPKVVVGARDDADHGAVRVSSARTSATAPPAFTSPAPCASTSAPAMLVAVYSRIAFTSYGESGAMREPSGLVSVLFTSSTS